MVQDKRIGRRVARERGKFRGKVQQPSYSPDQAFQMFFHAKSAEGLRKRTLEDYKRHFRYLHDWMSKVHPEITTVSDITAQILREYVYYLSHDKPLYEGHPNKSDTEKSKRGLAPGAVNVRLTTLKAMFRWLHAEGIIPTNPAENLKKQKVDEDTIGGFTDEQVELLLAQPDTRTFTGFRDLVLMRLLLETGMRIGEVLSLTVDDIDFKTRLITLKGERNKNRRVRVVPFSTEMARMLMELVSENRSYFPDARHVFLANYGEPLSKDTITHRIKEYGIKAGIADEVRCSPHTFRHTMALNFLKAGGDIIALQRILGHSSMEMVRKYVQHRTEDLREQLDRFARYRKMTEGRRRY